MQVFSGIERIFFAEYSGIARLSGSLRGNRFHATFRFRETLRFGETFRFRFLRGAFADVRPGSGGVGSAMVAAHWSWTKGRRCGPEGRIAKATYRKGAAGKACAALHLAQGGGLVAQEPCADGCGCGHEILLLLEMDQAPLPKGAGEKLAPLYTSPKSVGWWYKSPAPMGAGSGNP